MKVNSRIKLRREAFAGVTSLPPNICDRIGVIVEIRPELNSLGRIVPYPIKCIFKHNDTFIFQGWFNEKELIPVNNKEVFYGNKC